MEPPARKGLNPMAGKSKELFHSGGSPKGFYLLIHSSFYTDSTQTSIET